MIIGLTSVLAVSVYLRACVRACVRWSMYVCVHICVLYNNVDIIVKCYLTASSMQLQQVLALVATLLLSGALAAAPGDESSTCQWSDPETQRVLMDSNRYSNLIKTRETVRVWREFDVDGGGPGNSVKMEWCIYLYLSEQYFLFLIFHISSHNNQI